MKKKLAVFDIDGTIAHHEQIPDSILDGFAHLQSIGYITTLSTGRNYKRVLRSFENKLDKLVSKESLMILEHGTKITNAEGEVVFAEYFSSEDIDHIIDYARANTEIYYRIFFATPDPQNNIQIWCMDEADVAQATKDRGAYSDVFHSSFGDLKARMLAQPISSVNLRLKPHVKVHNLKLKLTRSQTVLNFQDGNMEFMKSNTNKGLALSYLKNHFRVKNEDLLVAGNAINDQEMLNTDAKHRILVGHDEQRDIILTYLNEPENVIKIASPEKLGEYLQSL